MSESLGERLDAMLKSSQTDAPTTLLPDELSCLVSSFLPSSALSLRSKAYVTLSAICQTFRLPSKASSTKQQDAATDAMQRIFGPPIVSQLSDTVETEVLAGLSFLAALFEVDWQVAAAVFQEDGVLDSVMDALDLFSKSPQISRAVAQLLAQASGHKSCRVIISSQHLQWLSAKSRQTADGVLRAAAAVALVKLSRGAGADATEIAGDRSETPAADEEELVKLMRGLVVEGTETSSLADAVEGLAYMSPDTAVKEQLADDPSFLKRLFSVVPRRKGLVMHGSPAEDTTRSPLYGVIIIISNLCCYRPRLTEEENQMARLRRMANTPGSSSKPSEEVDPLDDDDHVRMRGRKLVQAGVLDTLTAAVRATESRAVRLAVGKSLLSLVEDHDNRGKVLQAGGAKALVLIIQEVLSVPSSKSTTSQMSQLDVSDIEPIQALAKLAITSSPVQVFGPNEGALYDAIRPFSIMLIHPNSTLLQRFEALMALTNLASQSGEVATRIARMEGVLNKVELLMLEEHTLVRRAATELICNLIGGCEEVYNKYGGEKSSASKSKLQVLVALCDVDDLQTRLAASGAIAILTSSPDACQILIELQHERHRVLPILGQLIDPSIVTVADQGDEDDIETSPLEPDPGLVHRGVICIRNLFDAVQGAAARKEIAIEADKAGVVQALVGVIKKSPANSNSPVLQPTAGVIKWLLENGIEITI
ncbi:ARM repeat-containing protein [Laetiporus sulphureus 93-53]|uniref:ARM repeat-containing protein n=1 Tax=Laetiporus sulphureus 93-53 TaxID=1314785 RepID=A0A165FB42_9APHY|nr:ARM repeat-containing protein [Laetiporus sulphureus 93-53]KZT08697.1 ARM repeat-containing protein [Laetiporus sulphureus 93-53]